MTDTETRDVLPEYNGWRNKPTWLVHLWLSNDEGTYNDARAIVREGLLRTDRERMNALSDYVESLVLGDEPPASLATDLLAWALAYVDWPRIVEAFLED